MEAIERTAPQLVFLDIDLGGAAADGFDLLLPRWARPPIVFSSPPTADMFEALRCTSVDYLRKRSSPAAWPTSLARAERQLDR